MELEEESGTNPLQHYTFLGLIGRGAYGEVYKAIDLRVDEFVAMKKCQATDNGIDPVTIREIAALRGLKHPNIVALKEVICCTTDSDAAVYLVLGYVSMDLHVYIRTIPEGELMPKDEQKFILYQILQGTCYCHQRLIMHRDLKPANILIDENTLAVKLADFGLARTFEIMANKKYNPEVATLWYRAPEIIARTTENKDGSYYSLAIDMWSIGCIFAEMARKTPLFNGESVEELVAQMCTILSPPDESVLTGPNRKIFFNPKLPLSEDAKLQSILDGYMDPNGMEILKRMLDYNPATRATAKDLLRDPYFSDVDRTNLPASDFDGSLQLSPG